MDNTRIMFLRSLSYAPCGCVAISVDTRNRKLSYQFSVLNPVDKFDRKMARHLALGRLVEAPVTFPYARGETLTMHDISKRVLEHLAASKAPTRAVRAANLWLWEQGYSDAL
jgi:hypothetical protein